MNTTAIGRRRAELDRKNAMTTPLSQMIRARLFQMIGDAIQSADEITSYGITDADYVGLMHDIAKAAESCRDGCLARIRLELAQTPILSDTLELARQNLAAAEAAWPTPKPSGFTIFCREADGTGTTYITGSDADNIEDAKAEGLANCLRDWNEACASSDDPAYTDDNVVVLGVARGDIEILEWDDCE